ncbi:Ltp family lipoprotein [Microbacterium insulae]|uniref:Ltp family lipoprotein n=1 Tax=Microbacterium insulae TaxID=483014 RepID=A0ABW3ADL4_9MICO
MSRPAASTADPGTQTTSAPTTPPANSPWYKRKAIVIPVGIVAGIILISGVGNALARGGGGDSTAPAPPSAQSQEEAAAVEVLVPDTTGLTAKEAQALIENVGLDVEFSAEEGVVLDRDNWTVKSTTPAAGDTAQEGDTVVVNVEKILTEEEQAAAAAEEAFAAMTVAQQSAVRSAESYLSFKGFSRAGLTQQLTSEYGEGFDPADAEFAIAHIEKTGGVDWNQEAVQSAESYLDFKGFSRDGLFEQLTSEYGESFTPEQANYALDQVGL